MSGITRRAVTVLAGGAAVAGLGGFLAHRNASNTHAAAVSRTWIDAEPVGQAFPAAHRRLVHYATLAANGHNTQPWLFEISPDAIAIRPDLSRRTPVVDPDDHHLFASLGSAAENMVIAAEASGFAAEAEAGADGVIVRLSQATPRPSAHFAAIPQRQCVRLDYDGSAADPEDVSALEASAAIPGVDVSVFTARSDLDRISELVVAGNTAQMGDPAFIEELKDSIRFNGRHAAETGDGLYAASSGSPTLPVWLGRRLFDMAFTVDAENEKYRGHLATSAGVAVLAAERDDPAGWVAAGRAAQRFALEAAARGLKYAFLNQPIEAPEVRPALQSFLNTDRRANLLMRFGHGPSAPRSLRRPLDAVILA